jgi:predicted lipoprotein
MIRWMSGAMIATAVFNLSGCDHPQVPSSQAAAQASITKPANPKDTTAWHAYMGKVADPLAAAGAGHPYKFLVPSADDPRALDQRKQVEGALGSMAAANAFPGNVIAVGGPDPAKTADVMVAAFGKAKLGSLKTITVLYMGDDANQARVQKVIAASGATFRFAGM